MARWIDGWRLIVVNDAYRVLPIADVLYACDISWWNVHEGAPKFFGEKWSSHSISDYCDDKREIADRYGLKLVRARQGNGFSSQGVIHYGKPEHSGFQAINLALLFGASRIVLCGFDYGGTHFFGSHPSGLRQATDEHYLDMTRAFDSVATQVEILNATPGSRLNKFPMVTLDEALQRNRGLYRHGSISDSAADRICAP